MTTNIVQRKRIHFHLTYLNVKLVVVKWKALQIQLSSPQSERDELIKLENLKV